MFSFNSLFFVALATNSALFSLANAAERGEKKSRRKLKTAKSSKNGPGYTIYVTVEKDDQTFIPAMAYGDAYGTMESVAGSQFLLNGNAYSDEAKGTLVGSYNQQCTATKGLFAEGAPPTLVIEENICHYNVCVTPQATGNDNPDCFFLRSGGEFLFDVFNPSAAVPTATAVVVGGDGHWNEAIGQKVTIATTVRAESNGASELEIDFL